jgi:hypothetical protein
VPHHEGPGPLDVVPKLEEKHMSTTALAAVLTKFAGLNVAGKAIVGLAVAAGAAGAVGGAPAVAHQFVPDTKSVAVVEPAVKSVREDIGGLQAAAKDVTTDTKADTKSVVTDTKADTKSVVTDTKADTKGLVTDTTGDTKGLVTNTKSDVDGAVSAAADAAKNDVTGAVPDASTLVGQVAKHVNGGAVTVDASVRGDASK